MTLADTVRNASELVDRVHTPPVGITVLIYHRVGGGSDSAVDLEPAVFDAQLAHLVEHLRVLSLDDAVAELAGGPPPDDDRHGVVVTVDDGTDDFVDVVVPILERHRVPATLYVATHYVESGEAFPWGAPPTSWRALGESLSSGLVTLGSHTHSHWLLDRLDPDETRADLDRSIELLGERVGVVPAHFAYPKAVAPSAANEVEVRRRFASAALATSRVNRCGRTDPHRLWRTPVQRSDDLDRFASKAGGGMRLDGEVRALAARWRYRNDDR